MVALALRKTCGTLFASVCERRVFRLIYYLRSLFVEAGYMLSHTHRPTDQGGKGGLLVVVMWFETETIAQIVFLRSWGPFHFPAV